MDFIFDPKLWSGHTTGRNLMIFELFIESDLLEVHAKKQCSWRIFEGQSTSVYEKHIFLSW